MEEELEYIGAPNVQESVARAIVDTPDGWQQVKDGIMLAAAEILNNEGSLYYAMSILDSQRPTPHDEEKGKIKAHKG